MFTLKNVESPEKYKQQRVIHVDLSHRGYSLKKLCDTQTPRVKFHENNRTASRDKYQTHDVSSEHNQSENDSEDDTFSDSQAPRTTKASKSRSTYNSRRDRHAKSPVTHRRNPSPFMSFHQALNIIPEYSGNADMLPAFCKSIRNVLNAFGTEAEPWILSALPAKLKGIAAAGFAARITQYDSVEQLLRDLKRQYWGREGADSLKQKIRVMQQEPKESAASFGLRVHSMHNSLMNAYDHDPDTSPRHREVLKELAIKDTLEPFLCGLAPEIQYATRTLRPRDLTEAIDMAVSQESHQSSRKIGNLNSSATPDRGQQSDTRAATTTIDSLANDVYCAFCKKSTHDILDCRSFKRQIIKDAGSRRDERDRRHNNSRRDERDERREYSRRDERDERRGNSRRDERNERREYSRRDERDERCQDSRRDERRRDRPRRDEGERRRDHSRHDDRRGRGDSRRRNNNDRRSGYSGSYENRHDNNEQRRDYEIESRPTETPKTTSHTSGNSQDARHQ